MILDINDIHTYYGETHVLFGVSLTVDRGEVVSLLGPSGAGKTTTLRSILGLTPARSGNIVFDDRDITMLPTHEIAKAGVGWVPDDRRVFPTLTVSRNLSIACKSSKFRIWKLNEVFELFTALAVSDRVYIMDLGRIVHAGSAPDLLADNALRKKLLGI